MSTTQSRLELFIDVFEKKNQRALALPDLTPPELVDAVLQEFRELDYLDDTVSDYHLLRADSLTPLEDQHAISRQLSNAHQLVLAERAPEPPADAHRPSKHLYLREQPAGKVYKLHWHPAIIGRPGQKQTHTEHVLVNLSAHTAGLRVSRRHAQITEQNGQFFIESLSSNPTILEDTQGTRTPLELRARYPLQHGYIIHLERSEIALKFIVRDEQPVGQQFTGSDEPGSDEPGSDEPTDEPGSDEPTDEPTDEENS